ncbi:MAG: DUF362 domain-containing protein [Desulfobacterales bacterium]|nr:DUF362 domain-containing protein [Desulfobacterales bacterium]
MERAKVAIVRYRSPYSSLKEAVELCDGFSQLPSRARVFIKPNVVVWPWSGRFPKWGVITTSRVVEDMVMLLKEADIKDIIIGEGMVTWKHKDASAPGQAFEYLGYHELRRRYGVKVLNLHERPFRRVELGRTTLKFNTDLLESDFLINLPVLKTHAQTIVSLGLKNLKGALDISSRKKCHSPSKGLSLDQYISLLGEKLPPTLTLIDGIYSLERGPGFGGKAHRRDVLIASNNILAADMVGALALGHDPYQVPHLSMAAHLRGISPDLDWLEMVGQPIGSVRQYHQWEYPYSEDGNLPLSLKRKGICGISYPKPDQSLCTYCFFLESFLPSAIREAWRGNPFDNVEILTGKQYRPTPGHHRTILLGQCMCRINCGHPNIQEEIAIDGCPPKVEKIIDGFSRAGIDLKSGLLENLEKGVEGSMSRYEGREEFLEEFYRVDTE